VGSSAAGGTLRRVAVTLAVGAIGVAGLAIACSSRQTAGVRTVRIAVHQDPIAFLPVRVAHTLGYYEREGVAVEMSEVAGGTKAIQALLGGSVDVAAASLSDVMQLAVEGRDVRGFLLFYTRPTVALAVAPSMSGTIHSIRDLKGRAVGVTTPGSSSHQILNYLLVTNGVAPDEVSTVSVGMSASSVAALEHGSVAAAVLLGSAISAFERRHPHDAFLVDLRTADGARQVFGSETFPALGFVAEERWLHANADTARRLTRAVARGMQWVHEQSPEQVRDMLPEAARMTAEEDLRTIRQMQQVLSVDGHIPGDSMPLIEKFVAVSNSKLRAANIDLARLYTNEFTVPK
jgi:NitT/TauT family transport system substrate-binding protein